MKNSKHYAQYRQGDVLIQRIDCLPSGLAKQKPEAGRVILAHGEVTGHAHAFSPKIATKFLGTNQEEFFEVTGEEIKIDLDVIREWKGQVMVNHPTLGMIEFSTSDVEVVGKIALVNGRFGLLKHDEHTAQAIPAGFYKGAGESAKVRQREYSPVAIRNVAD